MEHTRSSYRLADDRLSTMQNGTLANVLVLSGAALVAGAVVARPLGAQ
jgi:hypothetical protein